MTETEPVDDGSTVNTAGSPSETPPDSDPGGQDGLEAFEQMFSHRYTEEDDDYKKTISVKLASPPCVENWRPRRPYDRSRGNGRGRGNWDSRRGQGSYGSQGNWSDRGQGRWSDRDQGRWSDRGQHGQGHWSGRGGQNQGYDRRERGYDGGRQRHYDDRQGGGGQYQRHGQHGQGQHGQGQHGQGQHGQGQHGQYYGQRHQPYGSRR